MKDKLVFVDAETDGLYGMFLSVAMVVTDSTGKEILDNLYIGLKDAENLAKDPWVRENVIGKMGKYESCEDETELLEKVWDFWMKYAKDSYAVADVQYPVESRLFQECVERDPKERQWNAPFPLLDLSTVLYWEGYDPLINRLELLNDKTEVHNALNDAKMTASVWSILMRGKNER